MATITVGRDARFAPTSTSTFTGVRDAATATVYNTNTRNNRAVWVQLRSGPLYRCNRSYFAWDTSGITGTVTSATLYIYGFGIGTSDMICVKLSDTCTGDSSTNFVSADFPLIEGRVDSTSGDGTMTEYSSEIATWSTTGYNAITLSADALADMQSLDEFRLGLIDYDYDYLFVSPGVARSGLYYVDYSGTGTDPYIEYTIADDRILFQDFNDDTGASDGSSATLPSGWEKADGGNMTVYSGQADSDLGYSQDSKGWVFGYGTTPSSGTGPGGGMSTETTGSDGAWTSSSDKRYMYVETSGWYPNKYNLIRTQAIDLSSVTAPVTMTFWFHMYGATMGNLGIAATTATHDASDASEAGTGLGFTSDYTGGATITYWMDDGGSTTATGVRIIGQQQTEGHLDPLDPANYWRKATVDLSAAVGESTVYIYFFCKSGSSYTGDLAIDAFQIDDFARAVVKLSGVYAGDIISVSGVGTGDISSIDGVIWDP